MKLDRNLNANGMGKYALLKLRKLEEMRSGTFGELPPSVTAAIKLLEREGILDWGDAPETEFFVIRLKDKYARGPLCEYATAAEMDGEWEYGKEVRELASRAGPAHPNCKRPD